MIIKMIKRKLELKRQAEGMAIKIENMKRCGRVPGKKSIYKSDETAEFIYDYMYKLGVL